MTIAIAEYVTGYSGPLNMTRTYQFTWKDNSSLEKEDYLPYIPNASLTYRIELKFRYGDWMWNVFSWNGRYYLGATNIFKYRRYNGELTIKDCIRFINEHVDNPKELYEGGQNITKFKSFHKYFRGKK